jgi:hypothetical protein
MKNNDKADTLESCAHCPQFVAKEIEAGLPAFCLYWREGLSLESKPCRNYNKGVIPAEPVSSLSDLPAEAPYCGQVQGEGDTVPSSHGQPAAGLQPGRHLVEIISVRGVKWNFKDYVGVQARIKMKVLEGPDTGKLIFDNTPMPHPKQSHRVKYRHLCIASGLGLIPWGAKGTIQVNWKSLEGVVCWVDVSYREFKGRQYVNLDNYELCAKD